jgi:predicted glycoside hydrolase/deacetylase ChbG (UPF0249 family)
VSALIVTADDLGIGSSRTSAILESLRHGHVTHASLLVNLDGYEEACELVRAGKLERSIGLHLNFTDGVPLTDAMKRSSRFCVDGRFRFPIQGRGLFSLSSDDSRVVRDEAMAQFAKCRAGGIPISHLDSHHHVHTIPNLASILLPLATVMGVRRVRRLSNCKPLDGWFRRLKAVAYTRQLTRSGFDVTQRFGDLDDLEWIVANGKTLDGSIEIMTHPCLGADGAILDGKNEEPLSSRLAKLHRHLPGAIDERGRIQLRPVSSPL